jgi:hypothetical protein
MIQPTPGEQLPPHAGETLTPEFHVPADALVGTELIERAAEEIASLCTLNEIPSNFGEVAMEQIVELIENSKPGEPVLAVSDYLGTRSLQRGGMALAAPYAVNGREGWTITVPVRLINYAGQPTAFRDTRRLMDFLRDAAAPEYATPYIVGEEAARDYMRGLGRQLTQSEPTPVHMRDTLILLDKVRSTMLGLDYLDISEDARYNLANNIAQFIVEDCASYQLGEALDALSFVTGMTEQSQMQEFCDTVEAQWADMLELGELDKRSDTVGRIGGFARFRELSPAVQELAGQGVELEPDVLHYSKMADLYGLRAEHEHAAGTRHRREVTLPEIVVEQPPERRDLSIFTSWTTNVTIAADIRYLRELHASGYTAEFAIERNKDVMYKGIAALVKYSLGEVDTETRLEVFAAMEFLFALKREEQRDELYRLLCERYAMSVPIEGRLPIRNHIGIAEAIGAMMPHPPEASDGTPYEGPARTAAVLAKMYRNKAVQCVLKFKATQENQESS